MELVSLVTRSRATVPTPPSLLHLKYIWKLISINSPADKTETSGLIHNMVIVMVLYTYTRTPTLKELMLAKKNSN